MSKITHMRRKPVSEVVSTWRWQRGTAVVLIFLSCWFVSKLVGQLQFAGPAEIGAWLKQPVPAVLLSAMIIAAYIHKHIGIHEILTDYLHKPCSKKFANLLLNLASAVLALATLAAIWHLHLGIEV